MMLIEETPVPDAALPVEAFKAHLRLGSGFGQGDVQDPVLMSFLRAAIAAVEARTGKVLLERSFQQTVPVWRNPCAHQLPVAPIGAVTKVELIDREGTRSDVEATSYWLERDGHGPKLRSTGGALPRIPQAGAVVVHFDAGFAVNWEGVPGDLRQAVLMLASHYYEYRHDTGLSDGCMPFGVTSLIERHKSMRLGAVR
ncbi:head-tail connector protein [Sulfitobacter sp. F26204]|uniref:head-tail connector protein n=1 Tax=Sulfitobacter sp. F26204 TaxID=2996014 RepID=UPI00225E5B61|nr:head-tail connector protein [Sulfitobacter sp. F26204]MCX7560079.1 head-tail connector protein [Sulfitobacter sp. F26204]